MKKQLVYTYSELDTFNKFITFLNRLSDELDKEHELTHSREEMLIKTIDMVMGIKEFFPAEDL